MSLATELAEVEAAISAVLKAQFYTYEGNQVTRADLGKLRDYKSALQNEIARESRGGRGPRVTGFSFRHG